MDKKYNVNFHQTFPPDLDNIARILNISDEYQELSKEEIFDITGIPTGKSSGKVVPSVLYAAYMNLINYEKTKGKFKITATDLGNIIKKEDKYLQEKVTQLICNYYLTSFRFGAKMWAEIFRSFPQAFGNEIALNLINAEIKKILNINREVNLSPFKNTYVSQKAFLDLSMLMYPNSKNEEKVIFNINKYNKDAFYCYCYTLLDELMSLDEHRSEFSLDEVFNEIKWHRGFQWNEDFAFEVLEKFKNENLIVINKQLSPITIFINTDKLSLAKKIYSFII